MKYAEECKPVTRQVCEKVHYAPVCRDVITQECSQVPKEDCRQVPEEVCSDVNERKCETVEKEECVNVPRAECDSNQQCRDTFIISKPVLRSKRPPPKLRK